MEANSEKVNNFMNRWLKAILIAIVVVLLFTSYLYLRRGYVNLYILNKALGSAAVVLAGITLLVRPLLSRLPKLSFLMTIRRHLGLSAFGLVLGHVVVSVFFLPQKFPLSWYQEEWMPVTFGVVALLIWIFLSYISTDKKVRQLGSDRWRKFQSMGGRLAFILIFLHLTVMKYPGWIRWFNGQLKPSPELANPSYPPASLFVFAFMLLVILSRIWHLMLGRKGDK